MKLSGRKKNPKTSFITKHFKIFSFSLEHVTALPQIFLVAMGKKATLCMKYFKSACSMITSSIENACWIYYSQSLISARVCALKNGKREKEDGLVAPNAWPFLIFLDKRSIWVVKTNWTSVASAAIGCGDKPGVSKNMQDRHLSEYIDPYYFRVASCSANSTIFISFKIIFLPCNCT